MSCQISFTIDGPALECAVAVSLAKVRCLPPSPACGTQTSAVDVGTLDVWVDGPSPRFSPDSDLLCRRSA